MNAGQSWHPYNPCYRAKRSRSSQISSASATLLTPPQSISVKERDRDPDTDLSFRLTSLSYKPDTRWTKKCSRTHGAHRPADAGPSLLRHARSPNARAHNPRECYFQGQGIKSLHAPPEPTSISSEKVIQQGTRSQGTNCGITGADLAHLTCENVARGTFPAAPKAFSVKEREGGLDTDLYFFLTPFHHKPDKTWARGSTHGTHEPAGPRRRTRECYAEPSPPC